MLNLFALKALGRVHNAVTWWKVGTILLVIVAILFARFEPSNFHSHGFAPYGFHGVLAAVAIGGIVFAYTGFEQAVQLGAETKNPGRNIPFALLGSLVVCSILYIGLQVAYIGACTGAKLEDLRAAASVLRGRRLAAGMRLMVAPASRQDQQQAEREGVMQALREAGAEVLPTTCGACAGYGGSIPDGASVISTTARNFKGRMGSETAQVYLASPYTVAASAAAGRIADPREFMA